MITKIKYWLLKIKIFLNEAPGPTSLGIGYKNDN